MTHNTQMEKKFVWLDVDPVRIAVFLCSYVTCHDMIHLAQGHDDALAILLAVHCTNIHLLGVSTVRSL